MLSPSFIRFFDSRVLLPKPTPTPPPEGAKATLQDGVKDACGLPPSDDEQSRAVQRRCHQLKYTTTEKVNTILIQNSFLQLETTMEGLIFLKGLSVTGNFRRAQILSESLTVIGT